MAKAIIACSLQIATEGKNKPDTSGKPESSNTLSIDMLVPPRELGAIIGKKGIRINELRKSTKAKISVADEGSVRVEGDAASFSEAIRKITALLYETRSKASNHRSQNPGLATAYSSESKSLAQAPDSSLPNTLAANNLTPGTVIPSPTLLSRNHGAIDSKIFLPGLLQNVSPKFSASGVENDKPSPLTNQDRHDSQQKSGILEDHTPNGKAGLNILPPLAGHAFPGSQISPTMFHFSDILHSVPTSQQAQQHHQHLLFIGNHWQHPQTLSPQGHQCPPSQGKRVDQMDLRAGARNSMQAIIGSLGAANLHSRSAHHVPQTFSSPFPSLPANSLAHNIYAGPTLYAPTQRFQPYSDLVSPPWQPSLHGQQPQSPQNTHAVPSDAPLNESVGQSQSMPADSSGSKSPWN